MRPRPQICSCLGLCTPARTPANATPRGQAGSHKSTTLRALLRECINHDCWCQQHSQEHCRRDRPHAPCRFAERHRRLLNALLRQNAALLERSLAPLLRAPRLIDFDNKRAHFRARVRASGEDRSYGTLRICVRREHVFEDSFHQLRMRCARRPHLASQRALCVRSFVR